MKALKQFEGKTVSIDLNGDKVSVHVVTANTKTPKKSAMIWMPKDTYWCVVARTTQRDGLGPLRKGTGLCIDAETINNGKVKMVNENQAN